MYGAKMPANLYFNKMNKYIKSGIIIYLDDDDKFSDNKVLTKIVREYKKGKELIYWRVKIDDKIIPTEKNWKKEPVCRDISGIGFAYDSKYKVKWQPYKWGDYRTANKLHKKIKKISYINEVLTQTQEKGNGFGLRLDKTEKMETYKIKFIRAAKGSKFKNGDVVELKAHVAKQFIINGRAIFVEDEKLKKTVKDFKEVKKVIKKKPAKRGRPKKVK